MFMICIFTICLPTVILHCVRESQINRFCEILRRGFLVHFYNLFERISLDQTVQLNTFLKYFVCFLRLWTSDCLLATTSTTLTTAYSSSSFTPLAYVLCCLSFDALPDLAAFRQPPPVAIVTIRLHFAFAVNDDLPKMVDKSCKVD